MASPLSPGGGVGHSPLAGNRSPSKQPGSSGAAHGSAVGQFSSRIEVSREWGTPLRYGDALVILDTETLGFLQSSSGLGSGIFVDQLQSSAADGERTITGINECPFILTPTLKHNAIDEFTKALAAEGVKREAWASNSRINGARRTHLELLEALVEGEAEENRRIMVAASGREVRYGDVLQLQHRFSQQMVLPHFPTHLSQLLLPHSEGVGC